MSDKDFRRHVITLPGENLIIESLLAGGEIQICQGNQEVRISGRGEKLQHFLDAIMALNKGITTAENTTAHYKRQETIAKEAIEKSKANEGCETCPPSQGAIPDKTAEKTPLW